MLFSKGNNAAHTCRNMTMYGVDAMKERFQKLINEMDMFDGFFFHNEHFYKTGFLFYERRIHKLLKVGK